jgi:hypothetical protein
MIFFTPTRTALWRRLKKARPQDRVFQKEDDMNRFFLTIIAIIFAAASLSACSGKEENIKDSGAADSGAQPSDGGVSDAGDSGTPYPDHKFIFEVRQPPRSVKDNPYQEEYSDQFRTTDRLATLDVRALAHAGGAVWAGTADGLFRRADVGGSFSRIALTLTVPPGGPETVVDIARGTYGKDGLVAVALSGKVVLLTQAGDLNAELPFKDGSITAVEAKGDTLTAGTAQSVFKWTGTDWKQSPVKMIINVRDLAVASDGSILVATPASVMAFDAADLTGPKYTWTSASGDLLDDDPRSVAVCGNRTVVGTQSGIAIRDGNTVTLRKAEPVGLPTDNPLTVDCTDGAIIIGHSKGATWLKADLSHTDHYISGRWMPDNRVPAVAIGSGTDRWMGTSLGASRIYLVSRRLADKEAAMKALIPWFWRMDGVSGGFVSSGGYNPKQDPYRPPSEIKNSDHDNDGLWTQMMIGGWCYAYAMTGNEEFYNNARLAMNNMFLLIDVPGPVFEAAGLGRGFIARSLVRSDEGDLYDGKVKQAEKIGGKDILRWHPVEYNGKKYLYKGDTSSDETTGHFFGFPVFYDLCAKTDEEKAAVAEHAAAVADYIRRNGFKLLDLDGTETTFGHWQPERIGVAWNGLDRCMDSGRPMDMCVESYCGGGWLNSLEILGMMLAAWHMTGDAKFYDAYDLLITKYHYDKLAMPHEMTYTITNPRLANHSDHELAMLAYTTLIRYEPNDDRRALWLKSLKFLYDYERFEHNPWWNAVYALSGGTDGDIELAVQTLREMPDDRREWRFDNSHRRDAINIGPGRHEDPQFDRTFPYDEIWAMWWNGNPANVADGGAGWAWSAYTAWLLPYYMNQWAGVITQ